MIWGVPHAALAVLLSVPAPAWFTFHAAYQDGLDAQRRGDHALAAQAFARAIDLEPRPGRQVKTYGLNFLPAYYPYLRQAESLLALGDLAGAERALALSGRLGIEPASEREALARRLRPDPQKPPPPAPAPVQSQVPANLPPPGPVAPLETPVQEKPEAPKAREPEPARARPAARPAPAPAAGPGIATAAPQVPARPKTPRWPWAAGLAALGLGLVLRRRSRPSGDPPALVTDPNLMRSFGPYRPVRLLGDGGCASAYLGVHRGTGDPVALKVPHRHLAQDPQFRARFRREAALGARLSHPHIVPILTPDPAEEDLWIAMTFIEGTTLEAFLRTRGALPVPWAAAIATHVAEAIAHAHDKNVVHRDLKPANIMLNAAGAWVMDFGVARVLDGTATSSTMFIGTPSYAAPECLSNPQVGPEADGYALGLVLYEMLTGEQAFSGSSAFQILEAHRTRPLPGVRSLRPEAPESLCALVAGLARKAPAERPGDAEILRVLGTFAPIASWPPPAGVLPA